MGSQISTLDFGLIGIYFLAVLAVGLYFSRRERTSTEYFLAGRNVAWWAIGASLFASNISSEHFIGLAGSGAATGLAVGHFEWLACFCCLTLGWLFVPFYIRSGVFTMPEFLERRYGPACRWYLTAVSVITYVLTKISVTLVAGSLLLKEVVGWDLMTSSIVLVVATGIYTVAGGLAAVIYTEVIQTVVLIGGATLLTLFGLYEVGGWSGLVTKLDPGHFSMFKAMDHPDFPWTGIVFGAPILGIWYWCTDQFIVQRVLSAKDEKNARTGAVFAGFLKILPVFIMVLPGLIAAALYADVDGDNAYPMIVTRLLPSGLKGIVIAGLLAAIMSSLASCFNSCSTLITMDVYKKWKPNAAEHELVHVGRLSTGVLVVLGILWVPFIETISSQLFVYLQSVSAYISPPITACFVFGVLMTRLNAAGAISSLVLGFILGAARLILELLYKGGMEIPGCIQWLAIMNFLHFAVLLFVISTCNLFLVSFLTKEPAREKIRGLTFQTIQESPTREKPWHRTNVVLSIALVIIVLLLWYTFR
ncbi:MAG: sodium:solute symporter [bacterium]